MDFFQLREFTMLVKTLNYSEAAFRLNVSSSALSRHIQFLETELGEKLFVRTTRSIALTEFGKVFLPHAVMMLQDYGTCIDALTRFKSAQKTSFTLGCYYSLEEYDICRILSEFREKHTAYNTVISMGNMEELERGFQSKAFNVYTAINNPDVEDLNFAKVGDCTIKAVVRTGSALSANNKLKLESLSGMPLILPGRDSPYFKKIVDTFTYAGLTLPNIVFYGRFEDSIGMIKRDMGVALFQFRTDKDMNIDGLSFIDIEPEILFEYGVGYREQLTKVEADFVQHVREYAANRLNNDSIEFLQSAKY